MRGIPVLLNEGNSVFRLSDFTDGAGYGGASSYASGDKTRGLRRLYRRFAYAVSEARSGGNSFDSLQGVEQIQRDDPAAQILVIGAGETTYSGNVTYTDVAFAKHVDCICDAHDLPFPDASFDAVLACSILEHVVDPQRCVHEIERVLRPAGYVYAVTPFLQPVHMKGYDFTRFTPLGHRRLFRQFDDIKSGMDSGPERPQPLFCATSSSAFPTGISCSRSCD